jgi:hypothetical protein
MDIAPVQNVRQHSVVRAEEVDLTFTNQLG